ncbi:MAG TPA: hydroxymethylglutaryl-CoA synthase [Thermoplasmata archaeon]|nr:hydroxymethylglutaryl-CoA synthase [Thermoplasmata archaeon]HUJ78176.1 hydroxymethylglutaryl-CoA synthase [Thermoplasmata archaeon]
MNEAGIVSYGAYVPRYRITPEEIGRVWGTDGASMGQSLNVVRKSVPAPDEDTITISTEALRIALLRGRIDPQELGAVYVGSESHPYAVKPTATVVSQAVGATPNLTAADFEFACKAGTAAIQTCLGLVASGMVRYGVAIGSDTSQGAPGDALEYSASAGGAAFIIGREKVIARIHRTLSYTTDTPDFWRREGQRYPSHSGRFTGEPAYFRHVTECAHRMMEAVGTSPKEYAHVVFHQPNGKFPQRVGRQLGFTDAQMRYGLVTPYIGNTYSGAALIGLANVLDVAEPGQRVLVVGYGSGAGSDAFDLETTDELRTYDRSFGPRIQQFLDAGIEIPYAVYAKFRGKIHMGGS